MSLIHASTPTEAHYHIVSGLHIALRLTETFGQSLNWRTEVLDEVKQLGDQSLLIAGQPRSRDVSYSDYEGVLERAEFIARNAWTAMLHDTSLDVIAPLLNSLQKTASEVAEAENQSGNKDSGFHVPDVGARMIDIRGEICQQDPSNMTPLEKMIHDRDLKSIGAAIDAKDTLDELVAGTRQDIHVADLNVEFVNEGTLRSWLLAMAIQDALPGSPQIIHEALDSVERHHHADTNTKQTLSNAWANAVPALPGKELGTAVNALLASACSNRLESLEFSSVEAVRLIVDQVYEEKSNRLRQGTQLSDNRPMDRTEHELRELDPMLQTLRHNLTDLEAKLGFGVDSDSLRELRDLVDRVNRKAEAILTVEDREDVSAAPGQ